jgi:two-component system chemotaxis response regulator CheB
MNLRVLIIDDSAYNRKTIAEMLESIGGVEVVGRAFDGEEGLKLATQLRPDLITLDIEMPRMDGFTFLRILMAQLPTPVIVVSSHSRKEEVFQALELGALDFIAKPSHHIGPDLTSLRDDLAAKVATVRALRPLPRPGAAAMAAPAAQGVVLDRLPVDRVVCLGASTGGPPALELVFKALPAPASAAVLVAQHMPERFTRTFAERLNRMVSLEVEEAEEGTLVQSGYAYVAPGGHHMVVKTEKDRPVLHLEATTRRDRYAPSVDRLMASAAEVFGGSTLAVVMTGMGADGSRGVEAVRAAGGTTMAESEETAVVYGMPKEAQLTGCVDEVLALPRIAERIAAFTNRRPA